MSRHFVHFPQFSKKYSISDAPGLYLCKLVWLTPLTVNGKIDAFVLWEAKWEATMNILIVNGSPKGKNSTTLQTARYLEALHPEHSPTVILIELRWGYFVFQCKLCA